LRHGLSFRRFSRRDGRCCGDARGGNDDAWRVGTKFPGQRPFLLHAVDEVDMVDSVESMRKMKHFAGPSRPRRLYRPFTVFLGMLVFAAVSAGADYRAAILEEPSLPVAGFPTPARTFRDALQSQGIPLTSLDADQLADPATFNAESFDLLIVPTGASFPAAARDSLLAFLEKGGDLFCTGGYAFDVLWVKRDGQWVSSRDDWLKQRERARASETARIPNGGFESGADHWKTGSPQACSVVAEGAPTGQFCGQISNEGLGHGVAWETPIDVQPGQTYLIGAHAKTSAVQGLGFAFLAVYEYDAQGGLVKFIDFAQIRAATDWTRRETSVTIAAHTAKTVLRAGLYQGVGTLWIDEATCAALPPETLINAHYGRPEDGLVLDPRQLMLFSPDQKFAGESLVFAPDGLLASDGRILGRVEGFEATAQLNGTARWIPIIEARDKYDRFSGVPGAIVFHTAAPYKHSVWALFGVTNRDLFSGGEGRQWLDKVIALLKTGVTDSMLKADAPIPENRPSEEAPRVRFVDNGFTLEAGGQLRRACLFGTDAYCNVFLSSSHSPQTWRADMDGMRDYGLHMFENLQFAPANYVFTDVFEKQLDDYIRLAQQTGLVYMAGLLIGQDVVTSDEELRQQSEMCRHFARRFKGTPGLIYYLNGDFQLKLKDIPDIRRLWNDFLHARYGNDDALRAAWNPPPTGSLGDIPVADWPAQTWYDVHARDVALFKTELMKRWIGALCGAIRLEDQTHPITSEYYQRPFNGIDLRLTVGDMDVANFGYFDEPKRDTARLMATIKWNDMRRTGHGCNIGEFGVKTHDAWAPERGGRDYHIQRTDEERNELFWWVVHAALGMGVSKIQNWCWSDDPDRVFPWGMAYANPLRPKPVLKLYRNLRMLASQIELHYPLSETVLVLPDTWRLGAPEAMAHASLMNAIECLLASNVNFDVANEANLVGMAATPPKAIVMPLAYALDDASFAALLEAAERGANVYVSGDPAITAQGARDPARLEKAFGVKFLREETHASGLPFPIVEGLPDKLSQPAPSAIYSFTRGKGRLYWSPEPWETLPGKDPFVTDVALTGDPAANGYLGLMGHILPHGAMPLHTTGGQWRVMQENGPMAFFPRGPIEPDARVETHLPGMKRVPLTLQPRAALPAIVHCNRDDRIMLATGAGVLTAGDGTFVDGAGAWMIFSLDRKPLGESVCMAMASTHPGPLSWSSSAADLRAWMVEWREGMGRVVAPVPLERTETGWTIQTEPNELLVVAREEPSGEIFETLRYGPGSLGR